MTIWDRVIQAIAAQKTFLVTTHVNPDPDALGSQLAMGIFLHTLGKKVCFVNEEVVPKRFLFLPRASQIKTAAAVKSINFDVAIILDCGELNRIGKVRHLIPPGKKIINVDHHITNDYFGDLNLVQPKACSTAEILYTLFLKANHRLTKDLAFNLYMGLMTDTGSFRFENTTARTHQICADLMRFHFSVTDAYRRVYASIPQKDLKEFTKLISRFDILFNGQVVIIKLSRKILSRFSEQFDLRDTIFQFLRSMGGIDIFVILTEIGPTKTRINLRSTEKFNVATLAKDFQGGGHQRASGCTIEKSMKEAQKIFISRMAEYLRR